MPPKIPDDGGSDWSYYPAHMRPLSFPFPQADAARIVCRRIASLLESHLTARPGLLTTVRDGWEGKFHDEFETTWSPQSYRLPGLKEDLALLAGKIDDAIARANTINSQRATLRTQYLEDQNKLAAGAN